MLGKRLFIPNQMSRLKHSSSVLAGAYSFRADKKAGNTFVLSSRGGVTSKVIDVGETKVIFV